MEQFNEIATAIGYVLMAALALFVAVRALVTVLTKAADLTATPKDNEVLYAIGGALDKVIAVLEKVAGFSRAFLPKGRSK